MSEHAKARAILAAFTVLGVPSGAALGAVTTEIVVESDSLTGRLTSPVVCPGASDLVLFQREHTSEQLYLANAGTKTATIVSSLAQPADEQTFSVYDGQPHWMPSPDLEGRRWFVFSGGGAFNNRDIYMGYEGAPRTYRLTAHPERDVTPRFSPDGTSIVFVSTRTGAGDLYVIQGVDRIRQAILAGIEPVPDGGLLQLTTNPERDLYPDWDPTSRFVAYSQFGRSEMEATTEPNMGIAVADVRNPTEPPARLTIDAVQETRPRWSPDGNRIAFYASRRIEDTRVDVGIIEVVYDTKMDTPRMGRLVETGVGREVAVDVLPRENEGPEWAPGSLDSHPKALLYVRGASTGVDRIVVADVEKWESGQPDFESFVEPWGITSPQQAAWSGDQSIVVSAQANGRYGIFRVEVPASLVADRGKFERPEVANLAGRGGNWRWIVGGGVAAAAIILFRDEVDKEKTEIGDPPCPPGIEDC